MLEPGILGLGEGPYKGAKILIQIFCVYFVFHAILSNFRKQFSENFFPKIFFSISKIA